MNSVSFPLIADIAPARSSNRPEAPARETRPENEKFSVRETPRTTKIRTEDSDRSGSPARLLDERSFETPTQPTGASKPSPESHSEVSPTDSDKTGDAPIVSATPPVTLSDLIAGIAGISPGNSTVAATLTTTTSPTAVTSSAIAAQVTEAIGPAAPPANNQPATAQSIAQTADVRITGIPSSGQQQASSSEAAGQSEQSLILAAGSKTATATSGTQPAPAAQQTAASITVGRPGQGTTTSDPAKPASTTAVGENTILEQQLVDGDLDAAVAGSDTRKPTATFATSTSTSTASTTNDAATRPSMPQIGNQIMAQAMASSPALQTAQPESAAPPLTVPAATTGDALGVTQSFNAEMRAAIDTPTQTAAYTARGAVTAQPAAEQIAMQISRAADQSIDRMTVHLKPAELGKVTIELEIGPDNRLLAVISAERSETLELLQRDSKSLEKALNDAGIETDSGSLAFNLKGDGGAAGQDSDGDGKLHDGAVMLPGDVNSLDNNIPTNTPLILPEGRINIQV